MINVIILYQDYNISYVTTYKHGIFWTLLATFGGMRSSSAELGRAPSETLLQVTRAYAGKIFSKQIKTAVEKLR